LATSEISQRAVFSNYSSSVLKQVMTICFTITTPYVTISAFSWLMGFKQHISLGLMLGLLLCAQALFSQRLAGLTVIGNNLGGKTFSEQQIIDAFKARNNFWSNGKPLAVCLPETKSADAGTVCSKVYAKSVSEVQKFWLSQVFQGRSRAPHFFETDHEMIDFIQRTPGAIGAFVNEKNIVIPAELTLQINP